jgi:small conductance mechanosensitive channel
VLLRLLGLAIAGLVIVVILQNRQAVGARIRGAGGNSSRVRARIADIWHVLAVVYVVAFYFVWAIAAKGGFGFLLRATLLTIALIFGAQFLLFAIGKLLRMAFSISSDTMARHPGLELRANRYLPALRRLVKSLVFLAVAFAVLEVWGFGTLTWLGTDAGATLINTVSIIILVVMLALVLSELFGLMVERYLRQLDEKHVSGTRARTLLPLLRTAFQVVLIVMVSLVVLSQIGVDIAPLLAGAGVVGLAIGFGAQKLVQDVINGFFILVEDSVSIGDFVEAGGHSGVVESMTIRSIEMRDGDGVVHTVPFSSVSTVKNYSKDFAYAVVDAAVGYRENTDDVVEIIREVGEEMRRDSPVKDGIIGPIEIFGVNELATNAVMIRARFRTRPMRQWDVRREFLRRIKLAFDEKGIDIPFRQQTIYIGESRDGGAPKSQVWHPGGERAAPDEAAAGNAQPQPGSTHPGRD